MEEGQVTPEREAKPEAAVDETEAPVEQNDAPVEEAQAPVEETEADERSRLANVIESVLFAAGAPVTVKRLLEILSPSRRKGPKAPEVQAAIEQLREEFAPGKRGIQLIEVGGGYQFRTARENAEWVRAVFRDKPARLGRAALETLAIVAYKQPATRADIESVRGVDAEAALSTLLSRRLVRICGRKEAVGRPLLYSTTPEFLEAFGLKDLKELPSLKELGPVPDEDQTIAVEAPVDPAPEGGDSNAEASTEGDDNNAEASAEGDDSNAEASAEGDDSKAEASAEGDGSNAEASAEGDDGNAEASTEGGDGEAAASAEGDDGNADATPEGDDPQGQRRATEEAPPQDGAESGSPEDSSDEQENTSSSPHGA